MKIKQLIKKLEAMEKRHGNLAVMFQDPNGASGPFSADYIEYAVAAEDEYPEDYNMPEGTAFILLYN